MEDLGPRIGAAVGLAAVVSAALFLSGKPSADSRERVEQMRSHAVTAEEVRSEVAARRFDRRFDPAAFAARVEEDAERYGLQGFGILDLAAAQAHHHEIDEPIVLGPGKTFASKRVRVRISHEKVRYQQHGATITARHLVTTIKNISDKPLAYLLRARSEDLGECEVRGARQHNAMALRPGEHAEVVVCAGGGKVEITDLQTLEITDLGYLYLSKVPPTAVGHDGTTATAHRPMERLNMCNATVDTKDVASMIARGQTDWVDVADFYSRHDCDRFRFFASYKHTGAALDRLPAVPPRGDEAGQ